MSAPVFSSLYSLVEEGEPHFSASIVLCTSPLPAGIQLNFADLGEAVTPGYVRYTGATIRGIFETPITVIGQYTRLVSDRVGWTNNGPTPVNVTGIALVVHKDRFTPVVCVVVPSPVLWRPGARISGRLMTTAYIYDQGA